MSASFWITLWATVGSLAYALFENAEIWGEFKSAVGKWERSKKFSKWLLLWGIPAFTLVATVIQAYEAVESERTSKAQTREISRQSNELVTTKSNLDVMERKSGPRHLTVEQRSNLVQCLRPGLKGPIFVGYDWLSGGTFERKEFGDDFLSALTEAGFPWNPTQGRVVDVVSLGRARTGVTLLMKDPAHPPPHALLISNCFTANRIEIELMPVGFAPSAPTNLVAIWINVKQ